MNVCLMAGAPKLSTSAFERRAFTHAAGFQVVGLPVEGFTQAARFCAIRDSRQVNGRKACHSISGIPSGCSVPRTTVVNRVRRAVLQQKISEPRWTVVIGESVFWNS